MNRTSKAINLVLIGSSMILAGCYRTPTSTAQDTRPTGNSGGSSGGHYYGYRGGRTIFIPSGGGGGIRGPSGATVSPRGGFGAAGLAHAGS
jgi:hypothetical protein